MNFIFEEDHRSRCRPGLLSYRGIQYFETEHFPWLVNEILSAIWSWTQTSFQTFQLIFSEYTLHAEEMAVTSLPEI